MAKYDDYSYVCSECGNEFPAASNGKNIKKKFCVIDYYCPICDKCTEHIVVKNMDFFLSSIKYSPNVTGKAAKVYSLLKKRNAHDYR